MQELEIEESYQFLKEFVSTAVDACVPRAKPRLKKKNLYINEKAKQLKKKKGTLWHHFTRSQDPVDYARYTRCCNELRTLTRNLRRDFEWKLAGNIKKNPKAFWQYTNSHLKTKVVVGQLKDQSGIPQGEDTVKADIFNDYFSSVFTTEDQLIPELPCQGDSPGVDNIKISVEEVFQKLKAVKTTNSAGPDGIHPRVLYESANTISGPLACIFRRSLECGCAPLDWKLATVVPIFKKGEKRLPENYRPISLTAWPCKIMESLVRDQLMGYLTANGILSCHQHGFRPNRSCTTQLLEVLDDWSRSIEAGNPLIPSTWTFGRPLTLCPMSVC